LHLLPVVQREQISCRKSSSGALRKQSPSSGGKLRRSLAGQIETLPKNGNASVCLKLRHYRKNATVEKNGRMA